MPRMICRIRHRAGEPLGLAIYPAATFMTLPREIREMIYEPLLIDSSPITVYSEPPYVPDDDNQARIYSPSSKFPHLTLSLFRVNRTIAIESASLFYHHNTFKFGGRHQPTLSHMDVHSKNTDYWDALYSFLYCIGPRNRARLRYIEADISRPLRVTKDTDGTVCSLVSGSWMRKVHGRDQHARIYPSVCDESYPRLAVFDDVSPAIDAVFRILGHHGFKLQLSLIMDFGVWPQLYGEEFLFGWSEEVPDHVEAMRKQFTRPPNGEGERVEVLWKGGGEKSRFIWSSERLVQEGWEIVGVRDIFGPPTELDSRINWGASVCFTLRRKGISSL
ncbi:hypothetical protein K469DRAFT_716915 [Zopfia rhizophila CBS 207.26]|uniref:Uncharacterized protein n=1 Tax=Zopfia rhizophila CBS 207.26 TaxID=1314779 RepID=A0A6A6EQL2_9PEZI|nr:hypothetical protein K469DRAFT_716915 [Zopfia rhizophila CBS 207.26]